MDVLLLFGAVIAGIAAHRLRWRLHCKQALAAS
jgi:hypothetical protein